MSGEAEAELSAFFMLNKKELLTIEHLREILHITTKDQVIEYCLAKLKLPRKKLGTNTKLRHGRNHYLDIIQFVSSNGLPTGG